MWLATALHTSWKTSAISWSGNPSLRHQCQTRGAYSVISRSQAPGSLAWTRASKLRDVEVAAPSPRPSESLSCEAMTSARGLQPGPNQERETHRQQRGHHADHEQKRAVQPGVRAGD